jgi:hypothetical protein
MPNLLGIGLGYGTFAVLVIAITSASEPLATRLNGEQTPLPMLRPAPRGPRRTARGQCASLGLHRRGLAPPTPWAFMNAEPEHSLSILGQARLDRGAGSQRCGDSHVPSLTRVLEQSKNILPRRCMGFFRYFES